MAKMKFKVGDKVKFKDDLEVGETYGNSCRRITYLEKMFKDEIYKVVEADKYDLIIQNGFKRWFVTPEMIELAEDTAPTITQHLIRGNKTIVKLSNGKVGIAQCSPEDKFDVYEGLRVATARAYGREVEEPKKEEPKFEVWDRVKYTDREGDFGEGTIVEISGEVGLPYLVLFDKPNFVLHDGTFIAKNKYPSRCWWCKKTQLEKI